MIIETTLELRNIGWWNLGGRCSMLIIIGILLVLQTDMRNNLSQPVNQPAERYTEKKGTGPEPNPEEHQKSKT